MSINAGNSPFSAKMASMLKLTPADMATTAVPKAMEALTISKTKELKGV